jgi:hypothetical protein
VIRVFPRRTKLTPIDELVFIGDPPLFRPPEMPVRVSVTFTDDIAEGKRLARAWVQYYSDVQVGGPAFDDPGAEFVPGRFLRQGITTTSRGCIRNCPFCLVPKREGGIRELPIMPGHEVQDNNLLACSRKHIKAVFDMLRGQHAVRFSGGLDTRLLQDWHRPLLDSIKIEAMFFACDDPRQVKPLERASKILDGISIGKKQCYVLIGFDMNETLAQAEARCAKVYELGFLPFAMLHQNRKAEREWRTLQKHWCRPAIYRSKGGKA